MQGDCAQSREVVGLLFKLVTCFGPTIKHTTRCLLSIPRIHFITTTHCSLLAVSPCWPRVTSADDQLSRKGQSCHRVQATGVKKGNLVTAPRAPSCPAPHTQTPQ